MPKILISACFLGHKVRYDGNDNLQTHPRLQLWIKEGKVISICPEMAGGLPTPRSSAEIYGKKTGIDVLKNNARVLTHNGQDVTSQYLDGAGKTLALAQQHDIRVALLKARSPSCGSQSIYDGSFSRELISGMGVTAALLSQHNILIFDESQIDQALDKAEFLERHQ